MRSLSIIWLLGFMLPLIAEPPMDLTDQEKLQGEGAMVGLEIREEFVPAEKAGIRAADAPKSPYDHFPPAESPYYRVRYDASTKQGELTYAVNYTLWIPKDLKVLRSVIVHQHGCGEGSCKSGLTGAYDLHWQALAKKHDCALLSPSYEQLGLK